MIEERNEYEITYLLDPQVEEDARGELNSSIDGLVQELGGTIGAMEPMTPRRLAYPVRKNGSVFLRAIAIQLDPAKIGTFKDSLKRTNGVLRFTILNTAPRASVPPEIAQLLGRKKKTSGKEKRPARTAVQKPVTMEAVEKGIEEALSEEVK